MKIINPLFVLSLLVILSCCATASAQPQSSRAQEVSAADVRAYIENSKRSGRSWGDEEEKYVLDNFRRPELNELIDNWQARNTIKLSKDVRILVMVDYLLTEWKNMNVLIAVLDSIDKGESTSFVRQLKTHVASTGLRQYRPAKIQIEVNLSSVDVDIDAKPFGQSPNKQMFVVMSGRPAPMRW